MLAGGASRRMGRNKALIEVDGRAMSARVLDALREFGAAPLLVVGGDPDELAGLDAPVVADQAPGEGPVGGVLTALDHLASSGLVDAAMVLPCDLPDVTADALAPILEASAGDTHSRVWVAATDRMEPMCALWSLDAHGTVREQFAAGERALHRVIAELPHVTVTVDQAALRNANRPEDLR